MPSSRTDDDIAELTTDDDDDYYDNGEEEEEEEEEECEEEPSVYLSEDLISEPIQSEASTIPDNILEFDFSYGYDCRKYFNLTNIDDNTVVFSSGNFINFLSVDTKSITFRRSALGGGIGHIQANPNPEYPYFAVAENASITATDNNSPLIIIYEWPSLDVNCVLKGGSAKLYTHLDYSPDGNLLVSQGGEPDYLITIWNWTKRRILLRTKSYSNDVHRVKFSPYVTGQLTSCGLAHIKFWKMATTFTGLKLKGDLGRFGKTEYSDILGILPMPDEKVLSGCNWGNILVWDGGLIKLEVYRSLRRKCHDNPIVQMFYHEEELWTVSMDGHVRVWWYEKIDQADPPDDDRIIQIEPTYDFYTEGLMLMCIKKRYPDPHDYWYFGQDGNGGIWLIDLNTEESPKQSVQLYQCHGGRVADIAICPWGPYLVSLGDDGRIFVYNYVYRKMLFNYQFLAKGRCMLWLPLQIQETGDELIIGFDDGCLRVCILTIIQQSSSDLEENIYKLDIIQIIKPHNRPVTKLLIDRNGEVLVSGGEDSSIFIFKLSHIDDGNRINLIPIGFLGLPNIVTCLTWHYCNDLELLVGCLHGEIVHVQVPSEPQLYTDVSYLLKLSTKHAQFTTYKSQIRRDIKIAEIERRKAAKVERKREEMEAIKKENPGLDIDEDVFLADSDSEEELEPLFIPPVPNRILWMQSMIDDTIWLSMAGYDAGYIYEYKFDQKDPLVPYRFKMVDDADDIEISSFLYNYNKKYLIFAMQDGVVRVNKVNPNDYSDLTDYWELSMHDNLNGFVPRMLFSFDEKYLFTCGHDGNIFAYKFQPENNDYIITSTMVIIPLFKTIIATTIIEDESSYSRLSLEETKVKAENDRINKLANQHKIELRLKIKDLADRFYSLLERNQNLLPTQIIPKAHLELDERITRAIITKLDDKLSLVKRKVAFDVEKSEIGMNKLLRHFIKPLDYFPISVTGINNEKIEVKMLRQRRIGDEHEQILMVLEEKILEDQLKGRVPERPPIVMPAPPPKKPKDKSLEFFLTSLSPDVLMNKLGPKLTRELQKYRERKNKWETRQDQWDDFYARKPQINASYPEDDAILLNAHQTIGDFKLKTSPDYKVSNEMRETTLKKYKELLLIRQKQFYIRHRFNTKVFELREHKQAVLRKLVEMKAELSDIHEEIPQNLIDFGPEFDEKLDCPEKKFEVNVVLKKVEEYDKIKTTQGSGNGDSKGIVVEPSADQFEKQLLQTLIGDNKPDNESSILSHKYDVFDMNFGDLLEECSKDGTQWEHEMALLRLNRKLYEQGEIIKRIYKEIDKFNQRVAMLRHERFQVQVDGNFIDLFVLTLHQELLVLKQFETIENQLQEKVVGKMNTVLDMEDVARIINQQIDEHQNIITRLHDEERITLDRFNESIKDNKFMDFLRKVFKKKFKLPKVSRGGDEDSSSESSSSSSESDDDIDTGSIDSRDFRILKQDLNVCPKGCEQTLYDHVVHLRSIRHELEASVKDQLRQIDLLRKDIDVNTKQIRMFRLVLEASQKELDAYQKEKQNKLNDIRCTIILKYNQLQHLTNDNKEMSEIQDTLVFSQPKLSKLYKRVEELRNETDQQKIRHQLNVKHLTRMKTDIKFMKVQLSNLKGEMINLMVIKFGRVVDLNALQQAIMKFTFGGNEELNNLQEVLLKKLIYDLRMSLMDIKSLYIDEMRTWRRHIVDTQRELAEAFRDNTARLDLLTMLKRERRDLIKAIASQDVHRERFDVMTDIVVQYENEIEKLECIVQEQNEQIEDLKDEIKMLKTKGYPPVTTVRIRKLKPYKKDGTSKELEDDDGAAAESEQFATNLIKDMLEELDIKLDQRSTENFIKNILEDILKGRQGQSRSSSVVDFIETILDNVMLQAEETELTERQYNIVEATAEQLCTSLVVQEDLDLFNNEDDVNFCVREIIEEIVAEVFDDDANDPNEIVCKLIVKLIQQLPIDLIIRSGDGMDLVVERIASSGLNLLALDKTVIMESVEHLVDDEGRREMDTVLDEILDKLPPPVADK